MSNRGKNKENHRVSTDISSPRGSSNGIFVAPPRMAATLNGNGTDLEKELEAQFRKMGNELRRRYEGDPWGLDALLEALEAQLPLFRDQTEVYYYYSRAISLKAVLLLKKRKGPQALELWLSAIRLTPEILKDTVSTKKSRPPPF